MDIYNSIQPADFLKIYEKGATETELVIDVREPAEWDYYHLERSELLPMNTIPENLENLPKEKTLYVICAHGVRSRHVCQYLSRAGFNRLVNVDGGMAAVAELKGFQYD
ncbi:sulfurtransferase [Paenibacillus swuensis]|uniref:Sulfurtransferase n=1 Tax=Paenibacillus swuensis TaxID=1178515 RepID=A0A172TM59_9BACL|nr:rhodanese-like domain-containing protein [Paenibacillus swuensis]ANE47994.1 sulfurtransferase [Paenibacillus swuensis]